MSSSTLHKKNVAVQEKKKEAAAATETKLGSTIKKLAKLAKIAARSRHNKQSAVARTRFYFKFKLARREQTPQIQAPTHTSTSTEKPKVNPMKLTKQKIESYLTQLNDFANQLDGGEIKLNTRIITYKDGAIIEIVPTEEKTASVIFDEKNSDKDIANAFNLLHIDIANFLKPVEFKEYQKAINDQSSYFTGTHFIFDENKIFLIKDQSPNVWTADAAKQDVDNLIQQIALLPA